MIMQIPLWNFIFQICGKDMAYEAFWKSPWIPSTCHGNKNVLVTCHSLALYDKNCTQFQVIEKPEFMHWKK
jgi:hypothetical protein